MVGEDLDPLHEVFYQDASFSFIGLGPDRLHIEIGKDASHLFEADLQVRLETLLVTFKGQTKLTDLAKLCDEMAGNKPARKSGLNSAIIDVGMLRATF